MRPRPVLRTVIAAAGIALMLGCKANAQFDVRGWAMQKDEAKPYAIQQVGPNHVRFEVRAADNWKNDTGRGRNRAELKAKTLAPKGQDVWFSYQMKIDASGPSSARYCILGQFHQTSDPWDGNVSPPFSINLFPGANSLRFVKRYSTDPRTTDSIDTVMYESAPIQPGRWIRIVGHIVFGWQDDGTVELWLDGRKVVDLPHTSIGYNDVQGPYWKFGIYRAQATETLAVDYANMEIGTASLLDRVGHPLPIR